LDENYAPTIYYSSLLRLSTLTELLLAKGADVNARGGRYKYPLQAAVYSDDLATVELLLNHGAHVNAKSRIMGNALQMAACKSNIAIIKLLLDRGADFVSPGVMFDDVLQICLHQHNIDLLIQLISAGAPIRVPERPQWADDIHGYSHLPKFPDATSKCIRSSASSSTVLETAKNTCWSGLYSSFHSGKQFDTSFDIHTMPHMVDDKEIPFSGIGKDGFGLFEVHGRTTPDSGLISFIKIYNESFHWTCSGYFQADGNSMIGRWAGMKRNSGMFKLVRAGPSGSIGPLGEDFMLGI